MTSYMSLSELDLKQQEQRILSTARREAGPNASPGEVAKALERFLTEHGDAYKKFDDAFRAATR